MQQRQLPCAVLLAHDFRSTDRFPRAGKSEDMTSTFPLRPGSRRCIGCELRHELSRPTPATARRAGERGRAGRTAAAIPAAAEQSSLVVNPSGVRAGPRLVRRIHLCKEMRGRRGPQIINDPQSGAEALCRRTTSRPAQTRKSGEKCANRNERANPRARRGLQPTTTRCYSEAPPGSSRGKSCCPRGLR